LGLAAAGGVDGAEGVGWDVEACGEVVVCRDGGEWWVGGWDGGFVSVSGGGGGPGREARRSEARCGEGAGG
jgi:hypothetical protein